MLSNNNLEVKMLSIVNIICDKLYINVTKKIGQTNQTFKCKIENVPIQCSK